MPDHIALIAKIRTQLEVKDFRVEPSTPCIPTQGKNSTNHLRESVWLGIWYYLNLFTC